MRSLSCLFYILVLLVIIKETKGRFLLVELEEPTLKVTTKYGGKFKPFVAKTIGKFNHIYYGFPIVVSAACFM